MFSIVSVVYQDLSGLQVTMASISKQLFSAYEWIVVDGQSGDGTAEFLTRSEAAITAWISEPDSGIYDAMNKGIRLSNGRYIVFLNAGDTFSDPSVLQRVYEHLCESTCMPDVVFGGATLVLRSGAQIYRAPRAIDAYIWHGLPANHQATYFRRDRITDNLYDPTYRICGDYYIVAKLYRAGIVVSYINSSLVHFRVGGASFQNPIKLLSEPYKVQLHILRLPLLLRVISLAKRLVSTIGLIALSHTWLLFLANRFGRKMDKG